MRSSPSKIAILSLLALLASLPLARAKDRDATGGAAPQSIFRPVTPEEAKDPAISHPKEPEVDCYVELAGQDPTKATPVVKNGKILKPCLPQHDAFKRAAEAASYLAIYQQNFSDYGMQLKDSKRKKEIEEALKACVGGDPVCNEIPGDDDHNAVAKKMQNDVFRALVQYNFGKDLRAQMLENQTRAANLRTLDLPPQDLRAMGIQAKRLLSGENSYHQHVLGSAPARENTFKLDPNNLPPVYDPTKLTTSERARLGTEFNGLFNQFVDEYTSSTGQRGPKSRWAYVPAKSSAVGGENVWVIAPDFKNLDAREGKAAIDKGRLDFDVKSQQAKRIEEIVAAYRQNFKDVVAKPDTNVITIDKSDPDNPKYVPVKEDSMKVAYGQAGFGLPRGELEKVGEKNGPESPQAVASAVVLTINRAINETELKLQKEKAEAEGFARVPSSAGPGAPPKSTIVPSVTVDVAAFDKFLDDIWPDGSPKKP